jgi:hypothetical protein
MDHRRASGIGAAAGAPSLTGPSGRQPIDQAANPREAFQDEIDAELQAIYER